MQSLKGQLQAMEKHVEKVNHELKTIEENYEIKKKKFMDSSYEFQKEIKKVINIEIKSIIFFVSIDSFINR